MNGRSGRAVRSGRAERGEREMRTRDEDETKKKERVRRASKGKVGIEVYRNNLYLEVNREKLLIFILTKFGKFYMVLASVYYFGI